MTDRDNQTQTGEKIKAFKPERAKGINPTVALSISAKVKAMRAEGLDELNFSAGEPEFDMLDIIKQAA